ncbi:MAG: hypothetical protein BEN19_08445 [Epulopiscium sp. Nuni2H_MBin003]|nr:MAG: hypothetical protein BEN19_08445 [Epulopiscium sp. Nuni2H_MBin003]
MNIKDIRYFQMVAEYKNFTKAAEKLHITQSGLSKAIKSLENEIGITLIDRSVKKFTLTEKGKAFQSYSNETLIKIDSELAKLENNLQKNNNLITIGLPPVIGSVYFAKFIANFSKIYPYASFSMFEDGSNIVKQDMENGKYDIGVIISPVRSDKLVVEHIIYGEMVLVVHKSHRLVNNKYVNIRELEREKFITFKEDFMVYNKTVNACQKNGFTPDIIFKTAQWDFIIEMVRQNHGITIMPKTILERYPTEGVVYIGVKNPVMKWNIAIITKKNKVIPEIAKNFLEFIMATSRKN